MTCEHHNFHFGHGIVGMHPSRVVPVASDREAVISTDQKYAFQEFSQWPEHILISLGENNISQAQERAFFTENPVFCLFLTILMFCSLHFQNITELRAFHKKLSAST